MDRSSSDSAVQDTARAAHVPWPRPRYAWYVVGVLVVSYAFAILDRIAISLLVQPIKADLGLSDTQIGLLQGAAFGIFYSLFAIPIGFLVDRRSRRWILSTGVALWSLATLACGTARGFASLFLARIGVGVGEASVSPSASSLIADYFPPEKRGRAYGIFMMGSTLGMGLAYLLGAVALDASGAIRTATGALLDGVKDWQIVFFLIGAPGLLLAVLMAATVREPLRRDRAGGDAASSWAPLLALLKSNRLAYFTVIAGTVFNLICIYAQISWHPTLFIRVHRWSASEVSLAFGAAVLPIGILSSITAGWMIDAFSKRGRLDAPLLVMIGHSAILATFGTAVSAVSDARTAYVAFAINTISASWSYAAALAALNQVTPNELRGQITGVYTLVTGLVSMGVGAFAVGFLSDNVFTGPEGVGPSITAVNLTSALVAGVILLAGMPAFREAVRRAGSWTGR